MALNTAASTGIMMGPSELLSTIVEFSIGLAGFSGVIGIFIHRSGRWIYVDQFRITNLLMMSLTPGFLSFFSLGLLQGASNPQTAIKISSGVFAIVIAALLIFIPRARSRVPEQDKHLVGPHIFIPMSTAFAAILVLQAFVAISIIDTYQFLIFYYSLVLMLLLAVFQFARLILARPDDST